MAEITECSDELLRHMVWFAEQHGWTAWVDEGDRVAVRLLWVMPYTGETGYQVEHASNMQQLREVLGY